MSLITHEQRHSTNPIPVTPSPERLRRAQEVEGHEFVPLDTGQWKHAGACACGAGAAVMFTRRHWAAILRHRIAA